MCVCFRNLKSCDGCTAEVEDKQPCPMWFCRSRSILLSPMAEFSSLLQGPMTSLCHNWKGCSIKVVAFLCGWSRLAIQMWKASNPALLWVSVKFMYVLYKWPEVVYTTPWKVIKGWDTGNPWVTTVPFIWLHRNPNFSVTWNTSKYINIKVIKTQKHTFMTWKHHLKKWAVHRIYKFW